MHEHAQAYALTKVYLKCNIVFCVVHNFEVAITLLFQLNWLHEFEHQKSIQ